MKIFRMVLALLIIAPLAAMAQPTHKETTFILQTRNPQPMENPEVDCADAAPVLTAGILAGGISEIRSVETRQDGRMKGHRGERLGTLYTCLGNGEQVLDPFGQTWEYGAVYILDLNGLSLAGLGVMRARTAAGFPEGPLGTEFSMFGTASTASLMWIDEDLNVTGFAGVMTSNILNNFIDIPGYRDGAIITLRIFEERVPEIEQLLEALRSQ